MKFIFNPEILPKVMTIYDELLEEFNHSQRRMLEAYLHSEEAFGIKIDNPVEVIVGYEKLLSAYPNEDGTITITIHDDLIRNSPFYFNKFVIALSNITYPNLESV